MSIIITMYCNQVLPVVKIVSRYEILNQSLKMLMQVTVHATWVQVQLAGKISH